MKLEKIKIGLLIIALNLIQSTTIYSQCSPCVPTSIAKTITITMSPPSTFGCPIVIEYTEVGCPGNAAISITGITVIGPCNPSTISQQDIIDELGLRGILVGNLFTIQYEKACKAYVKIEFSPPITCWTSSSAEGPPIPPTPYLVPEVWKSADCNCEICCQEEWRWDGIKWWNYSGAGEINCTACLPFPITPSFECFDQNGILMTYFGTVGFATNCKSFCDFAGMAAKTDVSSEILKMSDLELGLTPRIFKNNINFNKIEMISKIEIMDVNGKLIQSFSKLTTNELDLSFLSAGTIFMKVTLKDGVYNNIKLIKE